MVRALVVAMVCGLLGSVGCGGGGSSTPEEKLVGDWIIENDSTGVGLALDISADGTYVGALLALTNTNPPSANAQVEHGNWSATASSLTLTPTQWSCTGADPADTEPYSFSGGSLVISTSSGITTLAPNNTPATGMFSITYGCFDANGNFTQHPLGPVQ
jgi:hypothetical protein